jgi:hypothetical protein
MTLGGGGATPCSFDRVLASLACTLRQIHILKPDVLETAPMGHDPIWLLGSMGLTGGLCLDLQYVTIARHELVEHRAYDSAKE